MSTHTTAPQFDPSQEVPDEYDVFCESCGYSLAGIAADRCPECGAPVPPSDLPYARIPWLHRKRLGKGNAYLRTVLTICFHPARFAKEICRPVRISAPDARKFRRVTINLLTAILALVALTLIAIVAYDYYRTLTTGRFRVPAGTFWSRNGADAFFLSLTWLSGVAAFHLFLRLATDMPLFIWKGHPSLKPTELSPIHHYAIAPIAFAPFTAGLFFLFAFIHGHSLSETRTKYALLAIAATFIVPLWLWIVALVLMKVSTNPTPRRLLMMALYLPLHWFMMLAVSFMLWAAFIQALGFIDHTLHLHSSMFR